MGIRMAYVWYENGLSINVMYTIRRREARGRIQLSNGMAVPAELAEQFKSVCR